MYEQQIGRFISEDPIGLEPDPNLFRYVKNNPVNAIDPSGLEELPYGIQLPQTKLPLRWPEYPSYSPKGGLLNLEAGKNTGSTNFRNWLKDNPDKAHLFLMKLTSQYYHDVNAASLAYDVPKALIFSFIIGENIEFAWNDYQEIGSSLGCGQLTSTIKEHYKVDIKTFQWRRSFYNIPNTAGHFADPGSFNSRQVFALAAVIDGMLDELVRAARDGRIDTKRLEWLGGSGVLNSVRPSFFGPKQLPKNGIGPLASLLIEMNGENPHATGFPNKPQPYEYMRPFSRFQSQIIYEGWDNGSNSRKSPKVLKSASFG